MARDDNDIYLNFLKLAPLYPDIKFTSFSCRGRKTPPGGLTPVAIDDAPMVISLTAYVASTSSEDAKKEGTGSEASFEDLHSDKLRTNSRDEHNRSLSSIDIGGGLNRSRSNSINISPIEIDQISGTRSASNSFVPPMDKDYVHHASNGIVADEIDLIPDFVAMNPDEEDLMAVQGKPAGYDDDEDDADEESIAEEALLQAAKEAIHQAEEASGHSEPVPDSAPEAAPETTPVDVAEQSLEEPSNVSAEQSAEVENVSQDEETRGAETAES